MMCNLNQHVQQLDGMYGNYATFLQQLSLFNWWCASMYTARSRVVTQPMSGVTTAEALQAIIPQLLSHGHGPTQPYLLLAHFQTSKHCHHKRRPGTL